MAHFSNICRPLHLLNYVTNGKYLIQPPANFLILAETEQFCVSVSEKETKTKTKKERKKERNRKSTTETIFLKLWVFINLHVLLWKKRSDTEGKRKLKLQNEH